MIKDFSINKILVCLALTPTWMIFPETHVREDAVFVIALVVLVGADFCTGILKGLYNKDFSSSSLRRTPVKLLIYLLLIISGYLFSGYIYQYSEIAGKSIKEFLFTTLLITEFISLTENCAMISQVYFGRNIVPRGFLKLLRDFDENGNYIMPEVKK